MKRNRLVDRNKQICEMRTRGETIPTIAEAVGLTTTRVWSILKDSGLTKPRKKQDKEEAKQETEEKREFNMVIKQSGAELRITMKNIGVINGRPVLTEDFIEAIRQAFCVGSEIIVPDEKKEKTVIIETVTEHLFVAGGSSYQWKEAAALYFRKVVEEIKHGEWKTSGNDFDDEEDFDESDGDYDDDEGFQELLDLAY